MRGLTELMQQSETNHSEKASVSASKTATAAVISQHIIVVDLRGLKISQVSSKSIGTLLKTVYKNSF